MLRRCNNPAHESYRFYGGRGIEVCPRWKIFENFLEDMGPRPVGYQLDRIDNDGNYEPLNCRWVTKSENQRNTSRNAMYKAFGEYKCLADWADDARCVVSYDTMKARLRRGYTVENAMVLPHQKPGPKRNI